MRPLQIISGTLLGLILSFGIVVSAWSGPSASAPAGNVAAPLNVSSLTQTKSGALGVSYLSNTGDLWFIGSNRYLNFNVDSNNASTIGISGYGMRDNAGTLEFKNLGESTWRSLQSIIFNLCAGGACGSVPSGTLCGSKPYYTDPNSGICYSMGAALACQSSTLTINSNCTISGCPSGYSPFGQYAAYDGNAHYIGTCVKN